MSAITARAAMHKALVVLTPGKASRSEVKRRL